MEMSRYVVLGSLIYFFKTEGNVLLFCPSRSSCKHDNSRLRIKSGVLLCVMQEDKAVDMHHSHFPRDIDSVIKKCFGFV